MTSILKVVNLELKCVALEMWKDQLGKVSSIIIFVYDIVWEDWFSICNQLVKYDILSLSLRMLKSILNPSSIIKHFDFLSPRNSSAQITEFLIIWKILQLILISNFRSNSQTKSPKWKMRKTHSIMPIRNFISPFTSSIFKSIWCDIVVALSSMPSCSLLCKSCHK